MTRPDARVLEQDTNVINKKIKLHLRTGVAGSGEQTVLLKINNNIDIRIANRDRNLTLPYDKVIELIEEWSKNPLETQQHFAYKTWNF